MQNQDSQQMAYHYIIAKILKGELHPGEHIVPGQIAEAIGVSRTPVLAALQTLTVQGLAEQQANRGYFVAKYNLQQTVEIYEAREVIEGVAARTMAIKGEPSAIARLREICTSLESAEKNGAPIAIMPYDFQFHQYLIRNCGNGFLSGVTNGDKLIVMALLCGLPVLRAMAPAAGPWPPLCPHGPIVDAIEAGDPVGAEKAARQHIRDTLEKYRQYWENADDLLASNANSYLSATTETQY